MVVSDDVELFRKFCFPAETFCSLYLVPHWVARPHSWSFILGLKSYWWLLRLDNTEKAEKVVSSRPSLGFSGIGMEALENKASATGLRPSGSVNLRHTSL